MQVGRIYSSNLLERTGYLLGVRVGGLADSSLTETHATDENCVIRQISSKFVNFVVCDTTYDKIQPPKPTAFVFFSLPQNWKLKIWTTN